MSSDAPLWVRWFYRRVDDVSGLMMAVMFLTFVYQIVMRYVFDAPAAWAEEICVTSWPWVVLWGTATVTNESDTNRVDIVRNALSERGRRILDSRRRLDRVLPFPTGCPSYSS